MSSPLRPHWSSLRLMRSVQAEVNTATIKVSVWLKRHESQCRESDGCLLMETELSSTPRRVCLWARSATITGQWLILLCTSLVACDGPPDRTSTLGDANTTKGRQLVTSKGCVACHTFPDVEWPRGGLGPSLQNFGRQGLIAGRLPNQPGVLMEFVQNAPILVTGTAMPTILMTDQEARDVTAYLLTLKPR